jgi:release factor glutamine methyltransferase
MAQSPTIIELLREAQQYLAGRGVDSPRLDAELLLAHSLRRDRAALYRDSSSPVGGAELDRFREYVVRRGHREPLAYITGCREFWSHNLHVAPGVLIPRPETEVLVQEALAVLLGRTTSGSVQTVLDIGTGSGAIAVALAAEHARARVIAVDISAAALRVARANSAAGGLHARICCVRADGVSAFKCAGRIDLTVCNPPYIPSDAIATLAPEIRDYEPREALDGGGDGLRFYRALLPAVSGMLKADGWVACEIGAGQGADVLTILRQTGAYQPGRVVPDHAGRERVVVAQKNPRACGGQAA